MTATTLFIRADASPAIGTGHVMRCLALAQGWQNSIDGEVIFVMESCPPLLEERLIREGIRILRISAPPGSAADAEETIRAADGEEALWVVIDGYHFGGDYRKMIKNRGFSVLFIDDYGSAEGFSGDIILNQNSYANPALYQNADSRTRLLLGTRYSLLRREFLRRKDPRVATPQIAKKILVTLGGSDPGNVTCAVIEALKNTAVPGLQVTAVAGGASPHIRALRNAVGGTPGFSLLQNAENMPDLMAWADSAVSAGGSTCWELLFMGVPSIIIPVADNQQAVADDLKRKGIARVLDTGELENLPEIITEFIHSPEIRSGLLQRMAGLVDGKGSIRTVGAIVYRSITLRRARPTDCEIIFTWINDPLVRSVSFHSDPITLDRHREWFSSALEDPDLVYYIAEYGTTKPVGQARFKKEGQEAVISVLIDPRFRGMSLGSSLIRDATERYFHETAIKRVKAFIKMGNEPSRRAFGNAGYDEQGDTMCNGERAHCFIRIREKR